MLWGGTMQQYNVTAQIYEKTDTYKQTILMNELISSTSKENAVLAFYKNLGSDYNIVRIYSVEEILTVIE